MNKRTIDSPLSQQIDAELSHYFECASKVKCPSGMKGKLYKELSVNKASSWWSPKLAISGLSLVFISSVVFKITSDGLNEQNQIDQAHQDMIVAMHYMNRVSMKSLTAVNNKGIKPALIKPLAKSVASL